MSNILKSFQVNVVDTFTTGQRKVKEEEENSIVQDKILQAKRAANQILSEAEKKAQEITLKAKEDAAKVLEDTYSQAKNIVDAAREEGYSKGYEEGFVKGKEISDTLIQEANEIKKKYLQEREIILSKIEEDVINLVISLSEKIINQKLESDKEAIIPLIIKGIESLNVKESLVISVSKEDYDVVEMSKQRILSMANLIEDIKIRVDSSLTKGGCIVEGSKGNVDVSINTQIEEMKKVLYELLNGE